MSLEQSYIECSELTKERAKNFYYGIKLLPKEKRDSLCAVYAFFRISDDLSDEEEIKDKDAQLARWRSLVHGSPENAKAHPILPAFYDTVEKFSIPTRYFEELIEGTTSDLSVTRYPTFDDLYLYCYRVASTVGLVCLHIFGFDGSPEALQEAEARGLAFQLTNILRDVAEDGERGRIYLPMEDLERFGLKEDEFLRADCQSGQLQEFLTYQIERAKGYYEKSAPLSARVDQESRASLDAMTNIYRAVLGKIEGLGPGVFRERARLSKLEKLALAGKTAIKAKLG